MHREGCAARTRFMHGTIVMNLIAHAWLHASVVNLFVRAHLDCPIVINGIVRARCCPSIVMNLFVHARVASIVINLVVRAHLDCPIVINGIIRARC